MGIAARGAVCSIALMPLAMLALTRCAGGKVTVSVKPRRFVENISREPMSVNVLLPLLKCAQNPNPQCKGIAFAIQKVP